MDQVGLVGHGGLEDLAKRYEVDLGAIEELRMNRDSVMSLIAQAQETGDVFRLAEAQQVLATIDERIWETLMSQSHQYNETINEICDCGGIPRQVFSWKGKGYIANERMG